MSGFEYTNEGAKKAVLMMHGLTGSPFEMQKYGKFLSKNGYDVYGICLPGHGNLRDEIYTVRYQEWLTFAENKIKELFEKHDEVFVSGLCLGALISLHLAETFKDKIKGIICLSTTLYLDGWRLPWYKIFMPIALSTIFRYYYTYPESEPYGVKNEKTRNTIKKILAKPDVGMDYYPMSAFYELLRLSKLVRKNLSKINQPILIVHSEEDDLTSTKGADEVYKEISSEDKEKIILKDSYHMVLYDNEKDFVYNKSLEFLNKHSECCKVD